MVFVSEGLICEILYGHALETFDIHPNNCEGCFSGVQHNGFDFIGVAKLSVERGSPVL